MFESQGTDGSRRGQIVVRALVALGVCVFVGYEGASVVPRLLGYGASSRPNVVIRRQGAIGPAAGQPARFGQGFGFPGGFGFGQGDLQLVKQFDKDGDGRLNAAERKAAREYLNSGGRFPPGRRGFGGSGRREPAEQGPHLTPADVRAYPSASLYDAGTLRTIFLQFEDNDWEDELTDFYHTDVDVPATVVVDNKTYRDVGVHFRGNSSFRMVPEGRKHSLSVSFDFVHNDQDLYGYHTLHLLNANEDPTFLKPVLYSAIARDYIPAPKANFMRVVINGESWGVYPNIQPFNKDFLRENFNTTKGARFNAPGNPRARAGLEYMGDNPASYKRLFELRSKEDPKAWADLVHLCKVLNETPTNRLEAALAPVLDVDEALRFIALDNALINNDGYWTRASDYSLFEDASGKFHVIPHDFNETVNLTEGRGFGGGGVRPFSVELDPLIGLDDETKPLRSQLLAVPALRAKYLEYVNDIAQKWLDWKKLGPIAVGYQMLIADDVRKDTHKLYGFDGFDATSSDNESTKSFADRRREYLLTYTASH